MLYEIPHPRQSNRRLIKRWFASENIDIAVSDFIYARLMAHPTITGRRRAVSTDRFPVK